MSDPLSNSTDTGSQGKRRLFYGLAVAGTLGLLNQVLAQTPAQAPGGPEDQARMLERRMDHLIKAIDGTPEQKAKLTALAQTAMSDMKPLHEQHMAARKKGMELLAAAAIDRSALERLRGEQMQLAEQLSRRMLAHMADAAEVLTPVQRSKMAEKMKSREGRGGWGQHGGHHGGPGGWFR
jgi:periplasmic protein CpxP/Spy